MDEVDEIQELIGELSEEPKLNRDILVDSLAEYIEENDGKALKDVPTEELGKRYLLHIEVGIVMKIVRLLELLRG